ncbi:hypothetical protein V2W45_1327852 [Cenococcum geophilum]
MQRIPSVSLNPEYNLLASSTEHFQRGDGGRRQVPLALLNTRFGRTQEVRPQPSKQRLRDTSFARQTASLPPAPISAGQDPSNITNPAHMPIAQGFPAQLTQPPNKQSNDESDEEFDLIYEWYTNPTLTTNHFLKYVKPRRTPCLSNEPPDLFYEGYESSYPLPEVGVSDRNLLPSQQPSLSERPSQARGSSWNHMNLDKEVATANLPLTQSDLRNERPEASSGNSELSASYDRHLYQTDLFSKPTSRFYRSIKNVKNIIKLINY